MELIWCRKVFAFRQPHSLISLPCLLLARLLFIRASFGIQLLLPPLEDAFQFVKGQSVWFVIICVARRTVLQCILNGRVVLFLTAGPFYDNSCVTQEENETKASVKFSRLPANQTSSMESWQQSDAVIESHERRELVCRAPNRSNPVVGPGGGLSSKDEDVLNILNIFLRPRIKNVILVGDITAANAVNSDLALRIKNGNVPAQLQGLQILDPLLSSSSFGYCSSLEMDQKLAELSKIVGECMPAGAILHIGDLQWLAEPMQLKKGPSNFCPAQRTASELRQLLIRHASSRLWFVGVATPQTFSRLQVLYPSLIADWGLQPVPLSIGSQPDFLSRLVCLTDAHGNVTCNC